MSEARHFKLGIQTGHVDARQMNQPRVISNRVFTVTWSVHILANKWKIFP